MAGGEGSGARSPTYEFGRTPGGEPGDRRVGVDDQLFGTFARCRDLLRQDPVQAADRADLREKLRVAGGGVVFTTIQKFMPAESGDRNAVLSDRRNLARRSLARRSLARRSLARRSLARRNIVVIADEAHRSQCDFIDGFARHMRDALPAASYVGFTGTPIEKAASSSAAPTWHFGRTARTRSAGR